jgi:hypothetical protein
LDSLPQNSSVDAVEQAVRDIAGQLQRTELGLADLHSSVDNQTTTLQRLRTSLQDDISTEGRKLLEAQASMLLATLTAIRGSRHSALGNFNSLDQRLDEVDQRIGDSSADLKDMLDHQKVGVQVHLEYIEEAIQDICQVSNQQAARNGRNDWLEVLKITGAAISAFAGVSNILTIRTLKARLETPVGKKSPNQSITLTPPMRRYLAKSKREGHYTFIPSRKHDPERSPDPGESDRFTMAWDNATKCWFCHACRAGPYLLKTTPCCIECNSQMCDKCEVVLARGPSRAE